MPVRTARHSGAVLRRWRRKLLALAAAGLLGALLGTTEAPAVRSSLPSRSVARLPSGMAMPRAASGWRRVFADDFSSAPLNTNRWQIYGGLPGGDPAGCWAPSHAVVADGMLQLRTYVDPVAAAANGCTPVDDLVSAGVKTHFSSTYGRFEIRMRVTDGQGVAVVALLWPADGSWPPEIDFVEDNGAKPPFVDYVSLHYGPSYAAMRSIERRLAVNLSAWHTFSVTWSAHELVYGVDGHAWARVVSDGVPDIPMSLALQAQAWACGASTFEQCPLGTVHRKIDFDVDWVVAFTQTRR